MGTTKSIYQKDLLLKLSIRNFHIFSNNLNFFIMCRSINSRVTIQGDTAIHSSWIWMGVEFILR